MNKYIVLFVLCSIALSAIVEAKPAPCGNGWCDFGADDNDYDYGGITNNIGNGKGNHNEVHMSSGGNCKGGDCWKRKTNNIGNGRRNFNKVYMGRGSGGGGCASGKCGGFFENNIGNGVANHNVVWGLQSR